MTQKQKQRHFNRNAKTDAEPYEENVVTLKGAKRQQDKSLYSNFIKWEPQNEAQKMAQKLFSRPDKKVFNFDGCAGTGKTGWALWLAMQRLVAGDIEKIIVCRNGETPYDFGALPGDIEQKFGPFVVNITDIVNEMFGRADAAQILIKKELLVLAPTVFQQGRNHYNSVIIVDEWENLRYKEFRMMVTRAAGGNTKVILAGDINQDFLTGKHEKSGYYKAIKVMAKMPSACRVEFTFDDIIRDDIVKELIAAEDELALDALADELTKTATECATVSEPLGLPPIYATVSDSE